MPIPSLPLEGIRVIDVAEHGFVPTAAAVLAEYGADVIKVERAVGRRPGPFEIKSVIVYMIRASRPERDS